MSTTDKTKSNEENKEEVTSEKPAKRQKEEKIYDDVGEDTEGKMYTSLNDMWKNELEEQKGWYEKADQYWKSVDASLDGMLGGFTNISQEDVRGSVEFLKDFFAGKFPPALGSKAALDCGAGIGRVTKNLLLPFFDQVDLLEQNQDFLDKAKEFIASPKVTNFFCSGMQNFDFKDKKYDLIWIQWVAGHLSDDDFVKFFERCKNHITPNGLIVLKENNTVRGFIVDKQDSSVTRSNEHIQSLFEKAGLKLLKVKKQTKFPKELFPVRMYALR